MLVFILRFVSVVLSVLEMAIFVYCILSFLPNLRGNSFYNLVESIVNPILKPIRALLLKIPGIQDLPLDFSPVVAFLLISYVRRLFFY